MKLEDGHYQVALPWREFPSFSPYNRSMAKRKLQKLKTRFLRNVEKYLSEGHARRVPPEELGMKDKPLCMVSASSHGAEYALVFHKSPIRAIRKRPRNTQSRTPRHRPKEDFLSSLIGLYSPWEQLKRAVVWFLRFWFVGRYSQRSTHASDKSLTVN